MGERLETFWQEVGKIVSSFCFTAAFVTLLVVLFMFFVKSFPQIDDFVSGEPSPPPAKPIESRMLLNMHRLHGDTKDRLERIEKKLDMILLEKKEAESECNE